MFYRKSYKPAHRNDGLYRKLHRAPWLLATSLPHTAGNANRIMRAYAQRMEIEETFRDLKNHRWGFALRYARTTHTKRLEVLLLISALASLVLWLMGLAAKTRQWTRHFQANTDRHRNVLSIVFLGARVLREARQTLTQPMLNQALLDLENMVRTVPIHA